jgi:methylenetetrahydrofolate reductase (NADPH)
MWNEPVRPTFKEMILDDGFHYGVELVSTRGIPNAGERLRLIELGEALAGNERTAWISITDNPGGNPMLPPDWIAGMLGDKKAQLVIHLTCKDLNRNALESAAWRYALEGFNHLLALTGDYPITGYAGLADPVFDLDSVSLIALLKAMNDGLEIPRPGGKTQTLPGTDFFIGCAVSPFKRQERDLLPQYFKLVRKIRCGSEWVVSQLGYDMRKFHEIMLYLDHIGLPVPVVGNVYVLSRTVARHFHQHKIPGCVVSDALYAEAEKYAAGPDKGKGYFLELAAKQLAVFKGLGFAAGYLGGIHKPETFDQVIDLAESYGEDDWKAFAREIQFCQPDEFYLFEQDQETGLGRPGQLNRAYEESLRNPPRMSEVNMTYRLSRHLHEKVFTPGAGLHPTLAKMYHRMEKKKDSLGLRALKTLERSSKQMLFGCKDCGDCSLPDAAYLCPKSSCSKNCRNGPCGGTRDSECEVPGKTCIWARAYDRLKHYGETEGMLEGPAVFADAALQGTSAWANMFLSRDHHRYVDLRVAAENNKTPSADAGAGNKT